MKNKLFYGFAFVIICFISGIFSGNAQYNLVPNGSFEIFDTCPVNLSKLNYVIPWNNPLYEAHQTILIHLIRKIYLNHDYFGITPVGNQLKHDSYRINETTQLCFRKPELFHYNYYWK